MELKPSVTNKSGLFGPHHAHGVPNTGDLVKGDPSHPTHLKPVGAVLLSVFDEWAKGTPYEEKWKAAVAYLRDPAAYAGVPPVDISDVACHIKPGDHETVLAIGYWGYTTLDQVKGVVRVFLTPEPWKKRWRMISWTYTANKVTSVEKTVLATLAQTRQSVHNGPLAFSIDLAAWFNQLPYEAPVRNLFCVRYKDQWYHLKRAAMGHRPICFVGNTALEVATHPCENKGLRYIDNYAASGKYDSLYRDIQLIRSRALQANMTWNEDLTNPDALISPVIEFLGLRLNHQTKAVQLVDKVLAKLYASWNGYATGRSRSSTDTSLSCFMRTMPRACHQLPTPTSSDCGREFRACCLGSPTPRLGPFLLS